MSSMSRRNFILGILTGTGKNPVGKNLETSEFLIGRIADFPVGQVKCLPQLDMTIESLPEGLRARSASGRPFYSIETKQAGELIVNRAKIWPSSQVFSVLTSEPAYLETPSGE